MPRAAKNIVAVLIVTFGVVMFNYPTIASFVNDLFANRQISEYVAATSGMDEAALASKLERVRAYNQYLARTYFSAPLVGGDAVDLAASGFDDFDLLRDGAQLGYIEVPGIGVSQPIYYGTSAEVLDKGLGLVENSSLPVGGSGTHAVISGHTGLATRKLFTDLTDVSLGDLFFVHMLGQDLAYQVDQIVVVKPDENEELAIQQEHDFVTLLTCTPFGINDHRLLVRGTRIEYDFGVHTDPGAPIVSAAKPYTKWLVTLGIGALVVVLVVVVVRLDRKHLAKTEGAASYTPKHFAK